MAALCMLVLAGLLILYSTSAYNGQIKFQDPFYYLKKQLVATALGAAGAAIGLVPEMVSAGTAHANDIAVFTAMCMCWSGYLSTHVGMMSALKVPHLTGKAIISHTIGGLCAGVAANLIFQLVSMVL